MKSSQGKYPLPCPSVVSTMKLYYQEATSVLCHSRCFLSVLPLLNRLPLSHGVTITPCIASPGEVWIWSSPQHLLPPWTSYGKDFQYSEFQLLVEKVSVFAQPAVPYEELVLGLNWPMVQSQFLSEEHLLVEMKDESIWTQSPSFVILTWNLESEEKNKN